MRTGVGGTAEEGGAEPDATMPVDRMNADVASYERRAKELTRLAVVVYVADKLLQFIYSFI